MVCYKTVQLQNSAVTKLYVTKRYTNIMTCYMTVQYKKVRNTIFKNGIINKRPLLLKNSQQYQHRWARLLKQQSSITVYRLPTKENKLPFVSICSIFCIYIYKDVAIYIYIYRERERDIVDTCLHPWRQSDQSGVLQ
jgi:hypothetical protein